MALIDRKISTYAKDVSNLSDTPNDDGITAAELKAVFMGAAKEEIKTAVNGIIDDLIATADGASGADQIGMTAVSGLDGTTPQAIVESLNSKVVKTTGDQDVDGVKNFSDSPTVPIPTTDYQAAPKKYADDTFVHKTDYVRAPGYIFSETGTADRYAVTLDPAPALDEFGDFFNGMMFTFQVGEYNDNLTDTPTINVNGHGDTGIFKSTRINQSSQIPLKPGDLRGASFYTLLFYQGSFYVIAGDHDAEKLGGQLPAYYAADSLAVHTSGVETIDDVKTFLDSPIAPTPTEELEVANKSYVDAKDTTTIHKTGDETATGTKTFDDVKVAQNVDLAGYIFNSSSVNNAKIQPSTTGTIITRNISDSNPALIINQANSSSHGDVIRGQIAGTTKLVFTHGAQLGINTAIPSAAQLVIKSDGALAAMHVLNTDDSPVFLINSAGAITNKSNINTTGVIYNTSQSYGTIVPATNTAGVIVTRNVADANAALTVNQINASSTGNILDLQAAGASVVTVDHSGIAAFSISPTVPTPTTDAQVANKAYVDDTADTLVPISSIVNDLTTGGAAVPLSAEQGKTLNTNKADGISATNLITNGDFSNGITGWTGLDNTTVSFTNGYLNISGVPNASNFFVRGMYPCATIAGHKLYVKAKLRAQDSSTPYFHAVFFTSGFAAVSPGTTLLNNPVANTWYDVSAITTTTANGNNVAIGSKYASADVAKTGAVDVDNIIIIDLTATFGAGLEPTVAEMDAIMALYPNSHFNGTVSQLITMKQMWALKASKVQEAWITPTMTNSWVAFGTGTTAMYMKDQFGVVHLKGCIKSGTLGSSAFTLPVGYRPSVTRSFATNSNNLFGYINIASGGTVVVNGSNTSVYLDNVAFTAEA